MLGRGAPVEDTGRGSPVRGMINRAFEFMHALASVCIGEVFAWMRGGGKDARADSAGNPSSNIRN
jgi:hypothetical protein